VAQLTLIADGRATGPLALPGGFAMRSPEAADTEKLGQLYFDSRVPGARHGDAAETIQEVRSFFQGEFGDFWPEASGVIERDGKLVAALLAVRRAPWDDTPDCPFITDLFTDQRFRRQGLARTLLIRCLTQASSTARPQVALRVDSDNTPAMRLYQRMGFGLCRPE
jgi:ribosomal protein S18 acetylase RimI-like enzyme